MIELNGKPAEADVDDQIARMKEGATVKLKLANATGERTVKLKLAARDEKVFILQDVPNITTEQRAHRQAWIRGDDESGGGQ